MAQRKYAHRHLITRTISTTRGNVTYFDSDAEENKTVEIVLDGKYTAEQFLKAVKVGGIVLMVKDVSTETKLYGITREKFLENAELIED